MKKQYKYLESSSTFTSNKGGNQTLLHVSQMETQWMWNLMLVVVDPGGGTGRIVKEELGWELGPDCTTASGVTL